MSTKLIVNADDFGWSEGVNSAVARARREGILTSASLMVTGDAMDEAVALAREDPSLAVGLHLALSGEARSALPHSAIPDLVDSSSRFSNNPARAALLYYFNRRARVQLADEIEAQFEKFAATGLKLSHVDGHQHLHAHPVVLPIVLKLVTHYGVSGIRVPRDPFCDNLRVDRSHIPSKITTALGHAHLSRVCRGALRDCGIAVCDVVIGSMMSGCMTDDYVIGMLKRIKCDSIEMFFHPIDGPRVDPQGPNPGDLATLINPWIREFIIENDYELTTYPGLAQATLGGPQ
ncbi:MAG: hopanoid biosynthesis-associated protein HpnK [Armatimonadota bacterium]|nr:hopanoid biosynthesis-associated protein HpnK [bacterium]